MWLLPCRIVFLQVLCTVMSRPQLLAVLGRMEDAAQQDFDRTKQNSAGSSQWEVLDFGDVVVHVFTSEQREHYDIDSFYAAAEEVPLPFLGEWEASSSSPEAVEVDSSSSSGGGGLGRSGPVWSKNV
jgi:ribosomal silencing factor RsfS